MSFPQESGLCQLFRLLIDGWVVPVVRKLSSFLSFLFLINSLLVFLTFLVKIRNRVARKRLQRCRVEPTVTHHLSVFLGSHCLVLLKFGSLPMRQPFIKAGRSGGERNRRNTRPEGKGILEIQANSLPLLSDLGLPVLFLPELERALCVKSVHQGLFVARQRLFRARLAVQKGRRQPSLGLLGCAPEFVRFDKVGRLRGFLLQFFGLELDTLQQGVLELVVFVCWVRDFPLGLRFAEDVAHFPAQIHQEGEVLPLAFRR